MEDSVGEEGETNKDLEVAPALIAVHPLHNSVAVAVGSDLRVFDLKGDCSVSLVDDSGEPPHKDSIRAISFGAKGTLFASAGDDKLVKIWSTDSWRCVSTVCSEKRVSAVAISNDGIYVCFADKFGVVWVVDLEASGGDKALYSKKAAPILAHYCSIITNLQFSPHGQFIISADRDFKIRVTVFPRKPLDGAHEIHSFCLGHTEYISCLAFVYSQEYPDGFLVSGGGDATVRLWDVSSGSLFDTCNVGIEAGLLLSNGTEEECSHAVTCLCTSPCSTVVAVAIQSLQGVLLLNCDLSAKTLSLMKVVGIPGDTFIPTSLAASPSSEFLWMVTGVSNLHGLNSPSLARVKVISGLKLVSPEAEPTVLEDDKIPGGGKLLQKLQGSVSIEDKFFRAAADAVKIAMRHLLTKKQYSLEKREFQKRGRNDRKIKQ